MGIAGTGGVTAAGLCVDGADGPLMPLANEHNASQVRRATACCSASETAVFSGAAASSFFPVAPGAGVTSRAFSCESMVESVDGAVRL